MVRQRRGWVYNEENSVSIYSTVMQQHEKWLVLAILALVCARSSYRMYCILEDLEQIRAPSSQMEPWSVIRSDHIRSEDTTQRNAFWFHPARHRPLPRWQLAAGSLPLQAHSHRSPCGCPAPLDRARLRSVSATGGSLALLGLWVPALFLFASLAWPSSPVARWISFRRLETREHWQLCFSLPGRPGVDPDLPFCMCLGSRTWLLCYSTTVWSTY